MTGSWRRSRGDLSRRQAAVRYGVSVASAVRWQRLAKWHETQAPQQQCGDRRLMMIGAPAGVILDAYKVTRSLSRSDVRSDRARSSQTLARCSPDALQRHERQRD